MSNRFPIFEDIGRVMLLRTAVPTMSGMSMGGALDEVVEGQIGEGARVGADAADPWRAPKRVLTILRSILVDGGRVLRQAGLPILTISLLAFLAHGWLIEKSAKLAMDNGPLGLAVLIAAVALRLSALAWCLWVAADAITINGRRLTQIRTIPSGRRTANADPDSRTGTQTLTDGLRLVMAPMVIVYAAWNLIDWDIHSFVVAKQILVSESILETGVNADQSNISFVSGGWKTYIPWAVGCWLVKVAVDKLNEHRDWRIVDLLVVYLECAWVILTWLVLAPALLVARQWLGTRTVADWWESALAALGDWNLPWDLSLPDLITGAWHGFWSLVGTASAHVVWPLLWLALIGLIVGWVTLDEITVGRSSSRISVRNLSRALDTSTRGLQEKWQPIWQVFTRVVRLGVIPLLTIALAYAVLMVAAVWLRVGILHVGPSVLSTQATLYDLVLRLTQALVDPVRIALLTGAFAFVVRESLRRGESR